MNPPQKGKHNAPFPGREAKEGVPERASGSVQNHEQDRGHARPEHHQEGQGDGAETRQGCALGADEIMDGGPYSNIANLHAVRQTGEQWRGMACGSTFRIIITPADNLYPLRIQLQRLISFPNETETWVVEWGQ